MEGHKFSAAWATTRFRERVVGNLVFYAAEPRIKIADAFSRKTIHRLGGSQHWSTLVAMVLGFSIGAETDIPMGYIVGTIVVTIAWVFLRGAVNGRAERRFEAAEIPRPGRAPGVTATS